jgi:hypothetical protein
MFSGFEPPKILNFKINYSNSTHCSSNQKLWQQKMVAQFVYVTVDRQKMLLFNRCCLFVFFFSCFIISNKNKIQKHNTRWDCLARQPKTHILWFFIWNKIANISCITSIIIYIKLDIVFLPSYLLLAAHTQPRVLVPTNSILNVSFEIEMFINSMPI